MVTTQADFPMEVDGVGTWILPAFSTLPSVHPSPGQPGRSIFVGESFDTAIVVPPQIVSSGAEFYLVSEKSVTKLPSLTFPQKIVAADGTMYAASSPENVIALSATPPVPVVPTVIVDRENFELDAALASFDDVSAASTSHVSGSTETQNDVSGMTLYSANSSLLQMPSHSTPSTSVSGMLLQSKCIFIQGRVYYMSDHNFGNACISVICGQILGSHRW
jgi:hypothetical protein